MFLAKLIYGIERRSRNRGKRYARLFCAVGPTYLLARDETQPAPLFFACLYTYAYVLWRKIRSSIWSNNNNMQNQKFDHALVLKMTSKMRDDIVRALILTQDTLIRSRSEFIRTACQCFLDSLAKD